VRLAERTLEWDMAAAGNWRVLLDALAPIKPRVTARLRTELADVGDRDRADRILDAVTNAKGRFAQELAALLDDPDTAFTVPPYVTEAIEWVTS
jgi:putative ATP-dependent endonuclease of OLD family